MPSVGMVSTAIVADRIRRAIEIEFPEHMRADARTYLSLSEKAARCKISFSDVFLSVLVIFVFISAALSNDVFFFESALLFFVGFALFMWFIKYRAVRAKDRMWELFRSNVPYWSFINSTLHRITCNAGKFHDGLSPSQVTRIVSD